MSSRVKFYPSLAARHLLEVQLFPGWVIESECPHCRCSATRNLGVDGLQANARRYRMVPFHCGTCPCTWILRIRVTAQIEVAPDAFTLGDILYEASGLHETAFPPPIDGEVLL